MVDNSTKSVKITQDYFSHKKGDIGVIEGETTSFYTVNFNDGNLPCLVDKRHVKFITEKDASVKLKQTSFDLDYDDLF